ncbi:MAG: hypothetical protein ACLR4Z_09065 [Butyricicoccaceae bacterium]
MDSIGVVRPISTRTALSAFSQVGGLCYRGSR